MGTERSDTAADARATGRIQLPKDLKQFLASVPSGEYEKTFTRSEVANLAVLLSLQRVPALHVAQFFQEAYDLLRLADKFLLDKKLSNALHRMNARAPAPKRYRFSELLVPVESRDKRKKPLTLAGDISSEAGLKKAVKRLFPEDDAARILADRSMFEHERRIIIKDQENRGQEKALKMRRAKARQNPPTSASAKPVKNIRRKSSAQKTKL